VLTAGPSAPASPVKDAHAELAANEHKECVVAMRKLLSFMS
jgi:hypothetical protein